MIHESFKILHVWTDADDARTGEENGFEAGKRFPYARLEVIGPQHAEKLGFEWIFVVYQGDHVPPMRSLIKQVREFLILKLEGG